MAVNRRLAMRLRTIGSLVFAVAMVLGTAAQGSEHSGFKVDVLVNGRPRPEYAHKGKVYIEALRGKTYTLRITNPLPCRVAVALSVDGLNTIDAKRTDVSTASKWVLGPYETVEISGWQVSGSEARKFFFTGEKNSYGRFLGQTENLGTIEAVFFREKTPPWCRDRLRAMEREQQDARQAPAGAHAEAPSAKRSLGSSAESKAQPPLSDEYAATGIGGKIRHDVTRIHLDLEDEPSAVLRVRYEFTKQLVQMGILPRPCPSPIGRRERATGFEQAYCPDPYDR
jgi:hypothetical protein